MRFHLDEHVDDAVAAGLRRRGFDVTTTVDAGLKRASDPAHVDFALRESRVILTFDDDYLAMAARGVAHAGIIYCHQGARSIGQLIEFAVFIASCYDGPRGMAGTVEFA